jgi:MYND finger
MRVDYSKWGIEMALGWREVSFAKPQEQMELPYMGRVGTFRSCSNCDIDLQDGQGDVCARCEIAYYCSKDCQVQHWKKGHKKECVRGRGAVVGPLYDTLDLLGTLLQFTTSLPLFRISTQPGTIVTMSSVALKMRHKKGPNSVLSFYFSDAKEVERLIASLTMAIQNSIPAAHFPVFPNYFFADFSTVQGIDHIRKRMDPNINFAYGIQVGKTSTVTWTRFYEDPLRLAVGPLDKRMIGPYDASIQAICFAKWLESLEVGSPIHYTMAFLQANRPGVLWLRNIRYPTRDAFRRTDLKHVTWDKMLCALGESYNWEDSLNPAPAIFLEFDEHNMKFPHAVIAKHWPSLAKFRYEDIVNPNVMVGFFLTHIHSRCEGCIVTEFRIPISPELRASLASL